MSFLQGLELAAVTTESLISLHPGSASDQSLNTALDCLDWIIEILSQTGIEQQPGQVTYLSVEMEEVLTRSLVLKTTKVPIFVNNHLLVPRLTYAFYKTYYDEVLNKESIYRLNLETTKTNIVTALASEQVSNSQQELKDNIKTIAKTLVEQASANQQHQQDMAKSFDGLITVNENSLDDEQKYADELLGEIVGRQNVAEFKGNALKKCVETQTIFAIISAIFDIVTSLFSLVPVPSNPVSGITKIKEVFEKIRKVFQVISTLKSVYDSLRNIKATVSTLNRALEGIDAVKGGLDGFPTGVEWNDFDLEIEQYTNPSTLPSGCAGDAQDFKAACLAISNRGRVYLETMREIERIQYEIITIRLQKDTAERQAQRLGELVSNFALTTADPSDDVIESANLYDVGLFIQMRLNEVRLDLAKIYIKMDAALQHYYLQAPTAYTGYDIFDLTDATIKQMKTAETALDDFDHPPSEFNQPFTFTIPSVAVADIFDTAGITYEIPTNIHIFLAYQRVRVEEIRIWVDGVASSTLGFVQVEALGRGEFKDRDASNNIRSFYSEPLAFPFVYEIGTDTIIKGNRPIPDFKVKYMQITPFTKWVIRINPDNPNNHGLQFSDIDVDVRFMLYLSGVTSV